MIRRLLNALAGTANWRCSSCDTWNADSDTSCIACG